MTPEEFKTTQAIVATFVMTLRGLTVEQKTAVVAMVIIDIVADDDPGFLNRIADWLLQSLTIAEDKPT